MLTYTRFVKHDAQLHSAGARLAEVPLEAIRLAPANPRSNGEAGLDGLTASLAHGVAQPPVLIEVAPGVYEVLTGERRVRAALAAGWPAIQALVEPPLSPIAAHTRRLVENLHRADLTPLDEARALKLGWLCANAEALGLAEQAHAALAGAPGVGAALDALAELLGMAGWSASCPPVTQAAYLNGLGLGMSTAALRKKLQVLNLSPAAQTRLGALGLTEAGMRAFIRLAPAQQEALLAAIDAEPRLARKIKTIVQDVNKRGYVLEHALALARGEVWQAPEPSTPAPQDAAPGTARAAELSQAVLDLLTHAEALHGCAMQVGDLRAGRAPAELPAPSGEMIDLAADLLREVLLALGVD